jgi:hypothetical protein
VTAARTRRVAVTRQISRWLMVFLGCALAPVALAAEEAAPSKKAAGSTPRETPAGAPQAILVYKPPLRGKPRARVGGGVRSPAGEWPLLYVLVPEHTGQTISAQPSLFWYVDRTPPEGMPLMWTVFDDASVEPLIEAELPRPERPGIQRIDLARYGVRLEPGTEYEWTVALVVDPERRSNDIVAAGWIDRVEPPPGLGGGEGLSGARIYAEHGLWYDALAAVSDAIRADPADARLRASREALLRQVGLGMLATAPAD